MMQAPSRQSMRLAQINIDGSALTHNLSRVRASAPNSRIMAVIKANAYGHGVITAAQHLEDVDAFALVVVAEAVELRRAGVTRSLIVLQGFNTPDELQTCVDHELQPVIHQPWQAEMLACATTKPLDVWIKLDTGMHRLGIQAEDAARVYDQLNAAGTVRTIRFMSHFANADDPENTLNNSQIESFINVTSAYRAERSMANSAAIVALPSSHMDWVRPGIMLYGSSPLLDKSAGELDLKPVMTLTSSLISVQQIQKGEAIGYGSTWRCPETMPVGVVAVGYGDGYPRHAATGTPVLVGDQICPVVGRVSMDSICVDLRGKDRQGVSVQAGDPVQLWGNELHVDEVAQHAGTISYELLCHTGNTAGLV